MEILLHSKRESARLIGLSERTLQTLISKKQIGVRRVGRRVLVPHAELLKFTRSDHSTKRKGSKQVG
jgi:excisionase family DNA binding protein